VFTTLPVFVTTCWLLAMLPGAGQALILRQTLTRGRRLALVTAMGTGIGILIWSAAAGLGLSAILLANANAYLAIRLVGAGILVALGLLTLRAMRDARALDPGTGIAGTGRWAALLAGLGTNLGNPKAGVFAISLLPQFLTRNANFAIGSLVLGAIWATTTFAWYLTFTWLVERGRSFVTRASVIRGLDAATGVTLIALGIAVAIGV